MKRFLVLLSFLFCGFAFADTETINWYVGDTVYATNTCTTGGDITLPTTPTKYGYTFQGWAGYTSIEYLESTGTQYIDTEYRLDLSHNIRIITYIKFSPASRAFICGSLNVFDGISNIANIEVKDDMLRVYYESNNSSVNIFSTQKVPYTTKSKVEYIQEQSILIAKYNENVMINQAMPRNFITSSNIFLFRDIRENNNTFNVTTFIYSFQIYDNNTLVRDFIPVLDLNGTPCMYDKVSHQFFYNAGTGDFIAGPVINQ